MASNTGIPFAWLDILPFWALLKIDLATRIKHMKMNHRMEQLGTAMAFTSCCYSNHMAIFIYNWKTFFLIIFLEIAESMCRL
jgi:hypothetical protein